MSLRILFVDDEAHVLDGYKRLLRRDYDIATASSAEEAVCAVRDDGPFAVIVTDMQMPGTNGIELLKRVHALAPDTVRLMLTGRANLETATEAVNRGSIFRFLTKPCSTEQLTQSLDAALQQYRLVAGERELLEKTLNGSIEVLLDILSAMEAEAFGNRAAIRDRARRMALRLGAEDTWPIELAAMLARIGLATLPAETLAKRGNKELLTPRESAVLRRVPEIGRNLLTKIPRLEPVAEIVLYQEKGFDGSGAPADGVHGKDIPLGARILRVLTDASQSEGGGMSPAQALDLMREAPAYYDADVLDAFEAAVVDTVAGDDPAGAIEEIAVGELRAGDVLASSVLTSEGELLIAQGHVITEILRERLRNYRDVKGIREPILVVRTLDAAVPA